MLSTRIALALSLSACTLAAACDSGGDSSPSGAITADEARSVSTAVDNAAEPAYVGSLFAGSAGASDPAGVIAQLQASLQLVLALPTCSAITDVVIDTSGPSSLDASFDHCTAPDGRLLLDGALHAQIQVTTDPLTVDYTLESDGLTVGDRTLAGRWEGHHVLGEGQSTWQGDLTVTGPDGALTSSTEASFAVDGLCVTYGLDADVETSSGRTLSVHADQVTRCLGACPTSGVVTVAGSGEGAVSWSYDGSGQVTASASGGGSFQVDLRCQ